MLNDQSDLQIIEATIKEAKDKTKLGDDASWLANNSKFKNVIINGYFKDTAARLTSLLAMPNFSSKEDQDSLHAQLRSISELRQYLMQTVQIGAMARESIKEHELTREELVEGDLDNE